MPSLRRLKALLCSAFRFSSCKDADTGCPKLLDVYGVNFTVLRTASLRHAGVWGGGVNIGIQEQKSCPLSWLRSQAEQCFPFNGPIEWVTLRICLLVVLDVLSVFQSPRFNSFFGGKTFFLGAYSYIPHSGFPEVLWDCRMGTVISKSGRENELLRKAYVSTASGRERCAENKVKHKHVRMIITVHEWIKIHSTDVGIFASVWEM